MKRKILFVFSFALLASLLPLIPNKQVAQVDAEIVVSKEDTPRLQTFSFGKDASTTMTFTWNTTNYTTSVVEIVLEGQQFTEENILRFEGSIEKSKVGSDGFIHRVIATGLTPDTRYQYRMGDPSLTYTEVGSFKTSSTSNQNISFMHISDPQGTTEADYNSYENLLKASTSNFDYDFIALTGDAVNNSWAGRSPVLEQWEWALTKQFGVLKDYPLITVSGNHEAASYDYSSRFTYESVEQSGETGLYYSFVYEGVYFLCLNTNDALPTEPGSGLSDAQMTFIREDLELHKDAKWKIVLTHKGLFDSGSHSSNVAEGEDYDIEHMRRELSPLFNEYGVDLVLQGHDHLYSKSYPIKSESVDGEVTHTALKDLLVETKDNTKYVYQPNAPIYFNTGSASGSKYYSPSGSQEMLAMIESTENTMTKLFTNIEIDQENDLLTFTTYKQENEDYSFYKSFGINKGNKLTSEGEPEPPVVEPSTNNDLGLILGISIGGGSALAVAIVLVIVILLKKRGR